MRQEHKSVERYFDVQVGNRLRMARFRAKLAPAELAKMVGSDEAEIKILGNRQQRDLSQRAGRTVQGAERVTQHPAGLARR